jgi:FixJ family two-component response regulator
MECPEALKHVRTVDLRSPAQIRSGACVAAVITSDNHIMWQDDYLRAGRSKSLDVRCRVLDDDAYNNTGNDWIINTDGDGDDEFVFNFYGFEGEDQLDNIKRRALAVLDKSMPKPTSNDDDEPDAVDATDAGGDAFDEETDDRMFSSGTTQHRKADYSKIDWSLSNTAIAQQLGVTASAVYYQRRLKRPDTLVQKRKIDYTKIDWSLTNIDLARQFDVSPEYISYQRKLRGTYTAIEKSRKVDYTKVDWSQTDAAIALLFGVARKSIARQRKKRGIQQVVDKHADDDGRRSDGEEVSQFCVTQEPASRRRKTDYSHVDWSQTNKVLVQQLGVSKSTVTRQRKKVGKYIILDKYADIDWMQTNGEIATLVGVTSKSVLRQRKKRNIAPVKRRMGKIDYSHVDWLQANRTIARQLGVTRDAVARQRKRRGREAAKDRYADVDWTMTNAEIARQIGVSPNTVWYHRMKRKIRPAGRAAKIDYSQVDWSQSNTLIAQQLGIAQDTVARRRRRRETPSVEHATYPPA